jgi:hypothetical protein
VRTHLIGWIGACIVAAAPAMAQDIPPQETGPAQFTSRLVSGQLELRDNQGGRVIMLPRYPVITDFPASVETSIDLRPQPTGCDLVITAHNTGASAAGLGHFNLGPINLGASIESFNFTATSEVEHHDWGNYVASAYKYPNDLYSPVFVLRNSTYAMGISLQYPVMDYKHDVMLCLENPGGSSGWHDGATGWIADFWLGRPDNGTVQRWATLQPGESHTYVVSLRLTRNPQEWQQTLLPYRDYFRAHYGGVKYARDNTPIKAVPLSDLGYISPTNPFGFGSDERPDINGWGTVKSHILSRYAGWPTVVLWAPSGVYAHHPERNYPFQFTTHWNATQQLATVYDPVNGLPGVVAGGIKVGLWWGRSAEVATTWDTGAFEPLDPDNPSHVRAALAEMDGAERAGATLVGLDNFMHDLTPVWKAYPWIQTLRQRYPNIKFCTETSSCDIMHTIAPTFVNGWAPFASRPASIDDIIILKHPDYLSDFINPGHETWGQLSYQEQTQWFGTKPTPSRVQSDMVNFAAWGYRPVICDSAPPLAGVRAATTWETDLPPSIRDSDPYIADIRAGRLPGVHGASGSGGSGSPPSSGSSGGGASLPLMLPPSMRRTAWSGMYRMTGQPAGGVNSGSQMLGSPAMIMHMRRFRIEPTPVGQGLFPHYINRDAQGSGGNP